MGSLYGFVEVIKQSILIAIVLRWSKSTDVLQVSHDKWAYAFGIVATNWLCQVVTGGTISIGLVFWAEAGCDANVVEVYAVVHRHRVAVDSFETLHTLLVQVFVDVAKPCRFHQRIGNHGATGGLQVVFDVGSLVLAIKHVGFVFETFQILGLHQKLVCARIHQLIEHFALFISVLQHAFQRFGKQGF